MHAKLVAAGQRGDCAEVVLCDEQGHDLPQSWLVCITPYGYHVHEGVNRLFNYPLDDRGRLHVNRGNI